MLPGECQAMCQWMKRTAALKAAIPMTWLDVVMSLGTELGESSMAVADFKNRVQSLMPELYEQISDWKNLNIYMERVARASFALIEDFMTDNNIKNAVPLPQSWLRDILLTKGNKGLCPDEQFVALGHILGLVKKQSEHMGISLSTASQQEMMFICKKVSAEDRKWSVTIARKFLEGCSVVSTQTPGFQYWNGIVWKELCAGELDNEIRCTHDPKTGCRLWGWVKRHWQEEKAAQKLLRDAEMAEATRKAEEQLQEAITSAKNEDHAGHAFDVMTQEARMQQQLNLYDVHTKSQLCHLRMWNTNNCDQMDSLREQARDLIEASKNKAALLSHNPSATEGIIKTPQLVVIKPPNDAKAPSFLFEGDSHQDGFLPLLIVFDLDHATFGPDDVCLGLHYISIYIYMIYLYV